MSHKSRPLAIRAQYQSKPAGYSRLSFSKALRSTISLPHACDHTIQLGPPVGKRTGGDSAALILAAEFNLKAHKIDINATHFNKDKKCGKTGALRLSRCVARQCLADTSYIY